MPRGEPALGEKVPGVVWALAIRSRLASPPPLKSENKNPCSSEALYGNRLCIDDGQLGSAPTAGGIGSFRAGLVDGRAREAGNSAAPRPHRELTFHPGHPDSVLQEPVLHTIRSGKILNAGVLVARRRKATLFSMVSSLR